jgi:hypothetical protein
MVNPHMVNGGPSYFSPATFCESFAVFGRIPRFQNPFKYTSRFEINQKRAAQARLAAIFIAQYQCLMQTLPHLTPH